MFRFLLAQKSGGGEPPVRRNAGGGFFHLHQGPATMSRAILATMSLEVTIRRLDEALLGTMLDWAATEGWNPGLADGTAFSRRIPRVFSDCS